MKYVIGVVAAVALVAIGASIARWSPGSSEAAAIRTSMPGSSGGGIPSPSPSGIADGSQACAYQAGDGDYAVYVVAEDAGNCGQISQALATFGAYWQPVTGAARMQASGALPDSDRYCGLDGGGTTMFVYQVAKNDEPIGDGLAGRICQDEEANGWTPVLEGAAG